MTEERNLLFKTWEEHNGPSPGPPRRTNAEWTAWHGREMRFKKLMEVEAYFEAALMVLPEGWTIDNLVQSSEGWLWLCILRNTEYFTKTVMSDYNEPSAGAALIKAIHRAKRFS